MLDRFNFFTGPAQYVANGTTDSGEGILGNPCGQVACATAVPSSGSSEWQPNSRSLIAMLNCRPTVLTHRGMRTDHGTASLPCCGQTTQAMAPKRRVRSVTNATMQSSPDGAQPTVTEVSARTYSPAASVDKPNPLMPIEISFSRIEQTKRRQFRNGHGRIIAIGRP